MHQFYTLHRVLEGTWEVAKPVNMHFVDLEKAFDCVLQGILWGVLHEYGVKALRAVLSLYDKSRSLVSIASSQQVRPVSGVLPFYHWF